MCVAAIAWRAHPRWPLAVLANRDELHARPTRPLARWAGSPGERVLAGRDQVGGGTWLGITEAGRFALVVNVRDPAPPAPGLASRGSLILDLLHGRAPADPARYAGFTALSVGAGGARLLTNRPTPRATAPDPGTLSLSNGTIDERSAKAAAVEHSLAQWLARDRDDAGADTAPLFAALRDERPLSAHGVQGHRSAVFVRNPVYGTRCSTVVLVDALGRGTIVERSFTPDGEPGGEVALSFTWERAN